MVQVIEMKIKQQWFLPTIFLLVLLLLSRDAPAQNCRIDADAYLMYGRRSDVISSGKVPIDHISDFDIMLTSITSDFQVRVDSSEFNKKQIPCGRYRYRISAAGTSTSQGYTEVMPDSSLRLIAYLTIRAIESTLAANFAKVMVSWTDNTPGQPKTVAFSATDGSGIVSPVSFDNRPLILTMKTGVYFIVVSAGTKIVFSDLVYIGPGESRVKVDYRSRNLSFEE